MDSKMFETAICCWSFVYVVSFGQIPINNRTHACICICICSAVCAASSLSPHPNESECINLSICQNGIGLSLLPFPPLSPNTFPPVLAYTINTFPSFDFCFRLHFAFFASLSWFAVSFAHLHVRFIYIATIFGMHFCLSVCSVCCCCWFFSFHFICLIFLLDNIVVTVLLYCCCCCRFVILFVVSARLFLSSLCESFFYYIPFGICSIKLCMVRALPLSLLLPLSLPLIHFHLSLCSLLPGMHNTACINILSLTVYFS